MSAFTQLSQPAQAGRLALWVGVRLYFLFFFFLFLSLAVRVPVVSAARAVQNHAQCMCADVLRGLGVDTVRVKNKLHTHCVKGGIVTICSEYKTIYNLVLGENSGDYLLSGLFGH